MYFGHSTFQEKFLNYLFLISAELWNIHHDWADTYYPIFRMRLLWSTYVVIRHPNDIQVKKNIKLLINNVTPLPHSSIFLSMLKLA